MKGKIFHQIFLHDDYCKTLTSRKMEDCSCKPTIKLIESDSFEMSEKLLNDDFKQWKKNIAKNN